MRLYRQFKEGRGGLYLCSHVGNNEKIPKGYMCVDIINRNIKQAISGLNVGESTPVQNNIYIQRIS